MIALRYKKVKSGNYSVYLDITIKKQERTERIYEFLRIYVSRNYSKSNRIAGEDADKMELAQSIRSKRELELYGTVQGLDALCKRVNISLLKYVWDDYEKSQRHNYRGFHGHLKSFIKGKDVLFSDVNLHFLERFQKHMLKTVSQNTMVLYMNIFHRFMGKAAREEIISVNPFERFEMPTTFVSDTTFLELHEIQTLFDTDISAEMHICEAFLFSCFTGLRFSDASALRYSYFQREHDKDGNEITTMQIRPIKTSDKKLYAPLAEQAVSILQGMEKEKGNDFVFFNLSRITKCTVNNTLKRWAKAAGINKNLHFHVARHTFATLSLNSGIDIYTVSKFMGHTRLSVTQRYTKVLDEKKEKEIEKFPDFSFSITE